jgi:hypothetical protein
MHYFLYPEKDTTIYEASSSLNSGMDEILEIRKNVSETGATIDVSRILMKFDLTWVSESIVSGLISSPKYYLNLFDANPKALAVSQSLEAAAISGSWDMGTGRSYDNPQTDDGASWNYRYSSTDATTWVNEMTSSGAVWYASGSVPIASQSFNHKTTDMRMDVTGTVNAWLAGTVSNDGFIVKRNSLQTASYHASSSEGTSDRLGSFSFFSSNTNTIYPPTLEVMWDDSKWNTGSLSALSSANLEDSVIYMKGLRPEYKEKSKARFRLVGRERFPEKTYSTTPANLSVKHLPSGSTFYSIVDAETEDVIVPFGTGSRVSCDSTGNYFNLWLDGYQPERYYSILYRIVSGSGTIEELDQYFDEGFTFKVSL